MEGFIKGRFTKVWPGHKETQWQSDTPSLANSGAVTSPGRKGMASCGDSSTDLALTEGGSQPVWHCREGARGINTWPHPPLSPDLLLGSALVEPNQKPESETATLVTLSGHRPGDKGWGAQWAWRDTWKTAGNRERPGVQSGCVDTRGLPGVKSWYQVRSSIYGCSAG